MSIILHWQSPNGTLVLSATTIFTPVIAKWKKCACVLNDGSHGVVNSRGERLSTAHQPKTKIAYHFAIYQGEQKKDAQSKQVIIGD